MSALRLALGSVFILGFICAQNDNKPEIRGTVTDPGLNIGVAGAEISLFEFLLDAQKTVVRTQIATTSTDTRGEFRFPLEHFGEYLVEVKKEGYSVPSAFSGDPFARADVNRDHPTQDLRFLLTMPGGITGRVLDEDGNPVAGLHVTVLQAATQMPPGLGPDIVTARDGSFTATKLPAGQYSILVSPKTLENVTAQFSDDDLKIVDQDFDSGSSVPVPVSQGATSNVGIITARKAPYYRVHVSVSGVDCAPKESWTFSLRYGTNPEFGRQLSVPCGGGFLVRNLNPGGYWFTLRPGNPQDASKWALAEVEITRGNVEVSMTMAQTIDVRGHFVAVEGATLPKFQRVGIMMRGHLANFFVDSAPGAVNAEGKFTVKNLWGIPYDVSVAGLSSAFYVKEIRYNGVVMADGMVTPAQGVPAQNLEIVLDDKPATITGSVRDGDKPVSKPFVLVVKWPYSEGDLLWNPERPAGDEQGQFQISGLAPGEYRVIALTKSIVDTQISDQLLNRAERVSLERGSLKDITLKPVDPSQ